jgi:hypothetical protein
MQKRPIAFILILLLLAFQNCTQRAGSDSRQIGLESKGNGDGYAGKVKYLDLDLNNVCGGSPKGEIEVTNGTSGMITMENCQAIIPRPVDISALGLMPHDPANLVFNENLYQVVSDNSQGVFLCRANTPNISGSEKYVLDAIVKKTPGGLVGQVHLGIYDLNMALKSTISYENPIALAPGPGGSRLYVGNVGENRQFVLQLNDSPTNTLNGLVMVTVPDPGMGAITVSVTNVSCNLP